MNDEIVDFYAAVSQLGLMKLWIKAVMRYFFSKLSLKLGYKDSDR